MKLVHPVRPLLLEDPELLNYCLEEEQASTFHLLCAILVKRDIEGTALVAHHRVELDLMVGDVPPDQGSIVDYRPLRRRAEFAWDNRATLVPPSHPIVSEYNSRQGTVLRRNDITG